jgi:ubiquinone/menaquinone biosynthesis C-methylase UbiE
MKAETLNLLCHPLTHEPLQLVSANVLRGASSGDCFRIRDGIPVLLPEQDVTGANGKYRELYDTIARGYDLSQNLWGFLRYGGYDKVRAQHLREVEVRAGYQVLEVSVGTGGNVWFLPKCADYYGLDISWGMLKQCRRNARKRRREVELVCGSAEHLPFREALFDAVLHVGGINFFNDKGGAIREMVRVAKAGTRIVIVDEEEKVVKSNYERIPFVRRYFQNRSEPVSAPVDLVPPGVRDLKVEKAVDGRLYVLSFAKA